MLRSNCSINIHYVSLCPKVQGWHQGSTGPLRISGGGAGVFVRASLRFAPPKICYHGILGGMPTCLLNSGGLANFLCHHATAHGCITQAASSGACKVTVYVS